MIIMKKKAAVGWDDDIDISYILTLGMACPLHMVG